MSRTGLLEPDQRSDQCAFSGARTAHNHQRLTACHVEAYAMKNLGSPVLHMEIPHRDHWFSADGYGIVSFHSARSRFYGVPTKKNSAVNTRSSRTTRKIDFTTAAVVERPTCSAPTPVESPSKHPTAVIVAPNITLLISPVVMSRRMSASTETCR